MMAKTKNAGKRGGRAEKIHASPGNGQSFNQLKNHAAKHGKQFSGIDKMQTMQRKVKRRSACK